MDKPSEIKDFQVIESLWAIQRQHGYIREGELEKLSQRLGENVEMEMGVPVRRRRLPVYELHGVASFFPQFRLKPPPGKGSIHVCTDLPCRLRGAELLLRTVTTRAKNDPEVEVKRCSCLGQCDGAPAVLVNDSPHARLAWDQLLEMAGEVMRGEEVDHQSFTPMSGPFKTDPYAAPAEHYSALKALGQSKDFEGVLKKLKAGNLRGMGGSGKLTADKWRDVKGARGDRKFVICNADESEPGTIKDREILKNLPHLVIEGLIIAGLTLGASKGYVYLRHEYEEQANSIREEIKKVREAGLIGPDAAGSGMPFDLELFVSPGGYIQGEQTALMEAIEGNRGQPRNQAVDMGVERALPSFYGLWGRPTLVNNVETFVYVPCILAQPDVGGRSWFAAQGKNGCDGLKFVSVCGHVNRPGVFEVAMGTTFREVLEMAGGVSGGRRLKAFAPSGPTHGFLPARRIELPMDFPGEGKDGKKNPIGDAASSVGSGAIIVLAENTCMVDAALNFTQFYMRESCGKCVPCRVGSQRLVQLIAQLSAGELRGRKWSAIQSQEIEPLKEVLEKTSICGLGQVVPKPLKSVLEYWPEEVEDHRVGRACPSGVCFSGSGKGV